MNLNLNNQEVTSWLGEFEEKDGRCDLFEHEIPLQRSVSLDGGLDIYKYLQTVGSESGSNVGSSWTLDSVIDRDFRSIEDIPASQYTVKSRRTSFGMDTGHRHKSVSVLKDSYKGMDSESMVLQIKKLQRTFSFRNSFEDFISVKSSQGSLNKRGRMRVPLNRTVSYEASYDDQHKSINLRQRKLGMRSNIAYIMNLRQGVLLNQNSFYFKSCENLSVSKTDQFRSRSTDPANNVFAGYTLLKDSYSGIENSSGVISSKILKLKQNFTFRSSMGFKDLNIPSITVTDSDSSNKERSVAKYEETNTSNLVGVSRNCDCRICKEEGIDRTSFLRRILIKLFTKMVSGSRKLIYWDENNNLSESEMYTCIMQVLKLLFGLWLRHLDHN